MSPSRPRPPEYVLDTDVVVAGASAFRRRPPQADEPLEAQIIRRWIDGQWRWVSSEVLLSEHEAILIIRGAPEGRVRGIIARIRENVRIVEPRRVIDRLPDPKDASAVGTSRAAGAPLVTRNVEDYPAGVVDVRTPEQMIEEIESFLRHPMIRGRRSRAGRR